jgi:hypothetical protein
MAEPSTLNFGLQAGPIGTRLVIDARLDNIFSETIRDYRQGGVLAAAEGFMKRFHVNNFTLLGLSRP